MPGRILSHNSPILEGVFGNRILPTSGNVGLVFDRYLALWTEGKGRSSDWEILPDRERQDLLFAFTRELAEAGRAQEAHLKAAQQRQQRLETSPHGQKRQRAASFRLISRLGIGLGAAHPLENSLLFHPVLGVPYVPGSSIKGLCREAAERIGLMHRELERLFGHDADLQRGQTGHERAGDLICHDALPETWPGLEVEIINPHHTGYMGRNRGKALEEQEEATEHESPVPVFLLMVKPGTSFRFMLGTRTGRQETLEAGLELLRCGLEQLGVGSKTQVGYGRWQAVGQPEGRARAGAPTDPRAPAQTRRPRALEAVVRLEAWIGSVAGRVTNTQILEALAPIEPVEELTLDLLGRSGAPSDVELYQKEATRLIVERVGAFQSHLIGSGVERLHVLAFGPIPLLMVLGRALGDKLPMQLYQRHSDTQDWKWKEGPATPLGFEVRPPEGAPRDRDVAVLFSVSGEVSASDARAALRRFPEGAIEDFSTYVLRVPVPDRNILKVPEHVQEFRAAWRQLIHAVVGRHGSTARLHLFPALPIPLAIEVGRSLMQADPTMHIYERRQGQEGFSYAGPLCGPDVAAWYSMKPDRRESMALSRLTGEQLRELRTELSNVFTQSQDIQTLYRDAGFSPAEINWNQAARSVWDAVLERLNKEPAKLQRFLALVPGEHPESDALKALVQKALGWISGPSRADARVRGPAGAPARGGTNESLPKVVVVFTSAPGGEEPLNLAIEHNTIRDMLNKGNARERYRLEPHSGTKPGDLSDALLRHHPTVVHISGHGMGEDGLVLMDSDGNRTDLFVDAIAALFRAVSGEVECVVLNACTTLPTGEALRPYVSSVVATKEDVADGAAIAFSEGFYEALFHGRDYRKAFDLGVSRVMQMYPGEAGKWVWV